jgi:hypothetical protein
MAWSEYSDVPTDDARKCQVEGCHKKHAYSKNDAGRRIYSRYCSERTFPRGPRSPSLQLTVC